MNDVHKESPHERNKHGKKFERELSDAFKKKHLTHAIRFDRITDTAMAGNIIGKQDADFRLMARSPVPGCPYMFYLECKASVLHTTFGSCFRSYVKDHQQARLRLAMRAGAAVVYLFHSVETGDVELWAGKIIHDAWPLKRQKFYGRPFMTVHINNLELLAEQWSREPGAFLTKINDSERAG